MSVKTERIHALDALRAVMMLLGLVLHTSASYGEINKLEEWPFLDPISQHLIFDVILGLVHLFRMPIFFVVSGFFGALLFYERSPRRMFVNRFKRIVLPFLVGLIILFPIIFFAFNFSVLRMTGVEDALGKAWASLTFEAMLPPTTAHLWFLYYLALLTFFTGIIALFLKRQTGFSQTIRTAFRLLHRWCFLKIILLASPVFLLFHCMNAVDAYTSISLIPDWRTFAFYGIFYGYGWLLFKEKTLLPTFKRGYFYFIAAGLICFFVKAYLYLEFTKEEVFYQIVTCNALGVWFFIFGITGWFLTRYNKPSSKMRYISDAAYWVYLVHLPLVAFLPGLMFDFAFSPFLKFSIVLLTTTVFCFLTYHFFVRSSFVGEFLNGRRFK